MYVAEQLDGRPETDPLDRMWSVVDTRTGEVVASWRETPITGLTYQQAHDTAENWNRLEAAKEQA